MNSDPVSPSHPFSADLAVDLTADLAAVSPSSQPGLWPRPLERQPTWVRYGLLGAMGLLVFGGAVTGLQSLVDAPSEATLVESRALPVETLVLEPASGYSVPRIYTGEIAAIRSSNLGFERGGELVQVMVNEGDRVTAGTPLARLDTRNLATQRLQVEAQKAQAEARLAELENGARSEDIAVAAAEIRDLEQQLILQETQEQRREYLYGEGAISREQLDEFAYGTNSLQARLDQARSRWQSLQNGTRFEQVNAQRAVVRQLRAQLEDIDVNVSKSTITAPYDGIVARRQVDEGTVIGTGQAVFMFVEAATPEARVGVPVAVVDQLRLGSAQTVQVSNQRYGATVGAVVPGVDAATRTQTVVLPLDSAAIGKIEPGQTAQLTFDQTIQAEGFWLPTTALTEGIRGLWTCYVLVPAPEAEGETQAGVEAENPGGQGDAVWVVEPRAVEIIHQDSGSDIAATGTRTFVRGTLQPGEQVVTSGIHRLVPGQRVQAIAAN